MPCTPHGCRLDNGRAIAALDWSFDSGVVSVQFADGSLYTVAGLTYAEFLVWEVLDDPGCYWNTSVARDAALTVSYVSGPD